MNVNVLNKNLERVGVLMQYTSLIWDRKYRTLGDCELYLPASMDNINLLQKGYYLTRDDDDMVCVIRKIEITTDEEEGNMLIVTGIDVRCLFDQRIRPEPYKLTNRTVESWIRAVVSALSGAGSAPVERRFYKQNGSSLIGVKTNSSLTNTVTMELDTGSIGDEFRNLQALFDYGGRMFIENDLLTYETYKGTDRTASVVFGPQTHSLKKSDYVDDVTPLKNVTYIVGEYKYTDPPTGEQTVLISQFYGKDESTNRFEQIIKVSNTSMTKSAVESAFPGGSWQTAGGMKMYTITGWTFTVPDGSLKSYIQSSFPGVFTFSTSGGVTTATTEDTWWIADTTATTLSSTTNCNLTLLPMLLYQLGKARESQAGKPEKITFTAEIIPNMAIRYKEDFFLGDMVTLVNEYGISASARVSEVLESWNSNGYSLEIKFNE